MLIHLTIRTKTNLYFLSPLSLLPSHFLSLSLTPNTCTIHDNLVFNSNNGYFDMSMQYLFFKQVRLSNNYLMIYTCVYSKQFLSTETTKYYLYICNTESVIESLSCLFLALTKQDLSPGTDTLNVLLYLYIRIL